MKKLLLSIILIIPLLCGWNYAHATDTKRYTICNHSGNAQAILTMLFGGTKGNVTATVVNPEPGNIPPCNIAPTITTDADGSLAINFGHGNCIANGECITIEVTTTNGPLTLPGDATGPGGKDNGPQGNIANALKTPVGHWNPYNGNNIGNGVVIESADVTRIISKPKATSTPALTVCGPPVGYYKDANGNLHPLSNLVLAYAVLQFSTCDAPPPTIGASVTNGFTGIFTGNIGIIGIDSIIPPIDSLRPVSAPFTASIKTTYDSTDGTAKYYSTQLLALNISGGTLPAGTMIRLDPAQQSLGATAIAPNGGGFLANSFFDIFTELSTDGGATWGTDQNGPIPLDLSANNSLPSCGLTLAMSSTPVSTHGGSDGTATAIPSSGTPPYTYLWNSLQTTQTATGLTADTSTVYVVDANGCTSVASVAVTQPPPPNGVPTLNEWGLMALCILVLGFGIFYVKTRVSNS